MKFQTIKYSEPQELDAKLPSSPASADMIFICHYGFQLFQIWSLHCYQNSSLWRQNLNKEKKALWGIETTEEGLMWTNNGSRTLKSHLAKCYNKKWEYLQMIMQRSQNSQIKQAEQDNSDVARQSSGIVWNNWQATVSHFRQILEEQK